MQYAPLLFVVINSGKTVRFLCLYCRKAFGRMNYENNVLYVHDAIEVGIRGKYVGFANCY